jgi:alkylation response protein AidB-like acyl-CoA dehydrogenase
MDLRLTAEEAKFRDEMRTFFRTQVPEELRRKGLLGQQPSKQDFVTVMRILDAHGMAAPHWPAAWGGRNWTPFQKYIYKEELYLSGTPEPSGFNVGMLGPVLIQFGTQAQKEYFLPKLRNFDLWFCQSFSEPGAGSDLAALKTTAKRDGDHYVVNGHKIWTSSAHHADWTFLLARTNPNTSKRQEGISFMLVDMKTPGITVRPIITLDGRHETNEVFWDNVRVPVANLIHKEDFGWDVAKFLLGNERSGLARVGYSKLRLQRARELAELVDAGRTRLSEDHRLRERITELEVELKALEIMSMRAVSGEGKAGAGKPDPISSILKMKGAELLQMATETLVNVSGPHSTPWQPDRQDHRRNEPMVGPDWAAPLASNYFYFRAASIYGGSNEIQRNILAKAVLGL